MKRAECCEERGCMLKDECTERCYILECEDYDEPLHDDTDEKLDDPRRGLARSLNRERSQWINSGGNR